MSIQTPQLEHLSENVRIFWEEKQQELGETLLKFSYAIFVEPVRFPALEKSGIFYLMERNLWFEDFPKSPLFFFNKTSTYKKTRLQIPRSSISAVELVKRSTFEEKFFGRKPPSGIFQNILGIFNPEPTYLIISMTQDSGTPIQYAFRELDDPENWLQALKQT